MFKGGKHGIDRKISGQYYAQHDSQHDSLSGRFLGESQTWLTSLECQACKRGRCFFFWEMVQTLAEHGLMYGIEPERRSPSDLFNILYIVFNYSLACMMVRSDYRIFTQDSLN